MPGKPAPMRIAVREARKRALASAPTFGGVNGGDAPAELLKAAGSATVGGRASWLSRLRRLLCTPTGLTEVEAYRRCHEHGGRHPGERRR